MEVVRGFVQWDTAPPSSVGDVTSRCTCPPEGLPGTLAQVPYNCLVMASGGAASELYVMCTQELCLNEICDGSSENGIYGKMQYLKVHCGP